MTQTFSSQAIAAGAWTVVVDGADYQRFGLQLTSTNSVKIAIATAEPALDSQAFIQLAGGFSRELSEQLDAGDKVYAMADPTAVGGGTAALRGFRVAR